ncbi:PLP-dependent transferase [Micromonospora sp. DR5-3]|uniref:PLP-dependent transferase n=1 Tax=unclassified Micromonospora TaxID=2617518 RepID=UPI0011DAA53D|nr:MULTISPECIES: PLP-dependent transferase [unclassified Micromonospora]MCW3819849.1 PLP-dependent transferase [Micromonospora sp. DR5-3]TYC19923.1 PLP-dependent transferase [Micromonospora sp. MP36]
MAHRQTRVPADEADGTTEPDELDELDQVPDLVKALDICAWDLRAARHDIDEFVGYCEQHMLPVDKPVVAALVAAAHQARERIAEQRQSLLTQSEIDVTQLSASELALRFGLATLSYVRNALEWRSAAFDQSLAVQFFDLWAQGSPPVNYERYGHNPVCRVEAQLLEVLGLSPESHSISATSSGVAAYTLVESFLLRKRLRNGDRVLMAPYIYFEASEQLTTLPFVRVERASGYGVEEIIADVVHYRPRVLFVDPLANTAEQRMIDLPGLLARLRSVVLERTTVVIDGTMLSGGLPPELLDSDDKVEVLYYESGSKYLQLGMDAGMAGLVAYPIELREAFDRQRRNTGLILYRHGADLFPRYQRSFYRRRMRRIGANALRIAELLRDDRRVTDVGEVFYPGLPDHPDARIAERLPYAGGCVTFLFHERDRNTKDELNVLFDRIFANARVLGVQVTKGASFGFSIPRISAADAFAEGEPPFLRLYAGDRADQVEALAKAFVQALTDHVGQSPRDFANDESPRISRIS